MNLFTDHKQLDNLDFHKNINNQLKNLAKINIDNINNIVITGSDGTGRRTRVYAFLYEMFKDMAVFKLKKTNVHVKDNYFHLHYLNSNYHIEIDLAIFVNQEKNIFKYFLNKFVETRNIILNIPKIIILNNFNNFKYIDYVYCYMEKYHQSVKFIIITKETIPNKLESMCSVIRIPNLQQDEVYEYLSKSISKTTFNKIIRANNYEYSNLNLDFIFNYCEMTKFLNINLFESINKNINVIVNNIISNKNNTLNNIIKTRNILYALYTSNYDMKNIFYKILKLVIQHENVSNDVKIKVIDFFYKNDNEFNECNKEIFQLEKCLLNIKLIKCNS